MSDTSETVDALSGIHEMGVGLAIDDFGTGESSLARLKRFPVKILKIDKSFVDGLGILETDEAIVAAIVQLSKALGTGGAGRGRGDARCSSSGWPRSGCDLYQGYLMSRPISADQRRLHQATAGDDRRRQTSPRSGVLRHPLRGAGPRPAPPAGRRQRVSPGAR